MPAPLTEGNLYAIYAVLADYRQARDQHDTQAIADIAAGLDAWLRSLLEIVKSHAVIWVPCERRMPNPYQEVWIHPSPGSKKVLPTAYWKKRFWWRGIQCLRRTNITHWADIHWPTPPAGE